MARKRTLLLILAVILLPFTIYFGTKKVPCVERVTKKRTVFSVGRARVANFCDLLGKPVPIPLFSSLPEDDGLLPEQFELIEPNTEVNVLEYKTVSNSLHANEITFARIETKNGDRGWVLSSDLVEL